MEHLPSVSSWQKCFVCATTHVGGQGVRNTRMIEHRLNTPSHLLLDAGEGLLALNAAHNVEAVAHELLGLVDHRAREERRLEALGAGRDVGVLLRSCTASRSARANTRPIRSHPSWRCGRRIASTTSVRIHAGLSADAPSGSVVNEQTSEEHGDCAANVRRCCCSTGTHETCLDSQGKLNTEHQGRVNTNRQHPGRPWSP